MIVNVLADDRLELIYQPSHALLSAQVAARWRWEQRPERWWQTLVAISQHDNGWVEPEREPSLTGSGRPANFTERTTEEALAQWRRGVARGAHQGQWIGLLIARHAWRLYQTQRGEEAAIDAWLEEIEVQQEAWMAALGVSEEEVARADALMRWCDWFSLVLCWRRLPADGSAVSLGAGPDGTRYEAWTVGGGEVAVSPWPFTEPRFDVTAEVRTLGQVHFESSRALQEALGMATVETRTWTVRPGSGVAE